MRNSFRLLFSWFVVILSLVTLFFLFSVNQKGFDITDEGFHLLASKYPNDVEVWTNVAHVYTGLLYYGVGQNIVALRMLSELLLFVCATFFSIGFTQLANYLAPPFFSSKQEKLIAWAFITLGALFYYIHFDTTPCYNTLNAMLLYFAAGWFCLGLKKLLTSNQDTVASLCFLMIGLCVGILFLIKFPTAISLLALFSLALLAWPALSWKSNLLSIMMMLIGSTIWLGVHVAFLQSPAVLWTTLHDGINTFILFGLHKPDHCLQHYALETGMLIVKAFSYFWMVYLALFVGVLVFSINTVFWSVITLAALRSISLHFYAGGTDNSIQLIEIYSAWLLLFAFFVLLTCCLQKISLNVIRNTVARQYTVIVILLFALPFVGAVGTANILTLNLTQYVGCWFALLLGLLEFLSYRYKNNVFILTGPVLLGLFATSQIISSGFIAPYSLNTTIQFQTVSTDIGYPVSSLKLDPATHEFFVKMNAIAKQSGLKPGTDIFAFSNMPGLVFALGGRSPVIPWYLTLPHAKTVNESLLKRLDLERVKNAYILQNAKGGDGMPNLENLGIHFPSDYIFCGEAVWPLTGEWVRLWKPRSISKT